MRICASIDDLAKVGSRRIPKFAFDFLEGGAGEGAGVERNKRQLDRRLLTPRYLNGLNATKIDTSTTLFGRTYKYPFGISPTGMIAAIWPNADAHMAGLARDYDIPICNSGMASASVESVSAIAKSNTWFQLYPVKDDNVTADLLKRCEAVGVEVLVVTVDTPSFPNRNRDTRNRFLGHFKMDLDKFLQIMSCPAWLIATLRHGTPVPANFAPYAGDSGLGSIVPVMRKLTKPHVDWDDLKKIRSMWKGKLVVKGLMAVDDARRCVDMGCDGVWVSNHGGRQLESAPASIDALEPIKAAVGDRAAVVIDSGFRSGEDIVKAMALGADMVFVGRGPLFGMAADGRDGAKAAFDLYCTDIIRTLAQIGCPSIAALKATPYCHLANP